MTRQILKYAIIIFFLFIMASLMVASTLGDAATVDEPTHIFAGLTYIKFRDLRQNPEHPPLIKLLSGLSLSILYPDLNFPFSFAELAPALSFSITDYGAKMFLLNNPTKYLFFARLPIIAITLLGGVLIFLLSSKLGRVRGGICSLFFYVFEPNILAHGRLVTTDSTLMVLTMFTIFTLYEFWQQRRIAWFGTATLISALMILTKYSALLILPIIYLSFIVCLLIWEKDSSWKKRLWLGLIGIGLATWLAIWGFYSFFRPADYDYQHAPTIIHLMAQVKPQWFIQLFKQPILPAYFRHGASIVAAHNYYGQQFFLFGDFGNYNKWWLYPAIFLFKTPLPLLILFVGTLLITIKSKPTFLVLFLYLVAIGYAGILVSAKIFFGIRNLLPFSAIFIILLSTTIRWWLKKPKRAGVFFSLCIFYFLENILVFPAYLAYGNQLFGNRNHKMHSLADSNIDWGQDLKRLSQWLKQQGLSRLPFHYFGTVPPEAFAITAKKLPTREDADHPRGYVAVSISNYNYAYRIQNPDGSVRFMFNPYSYLDGLEPVKVIGDSIVIYKLP